MRSPTALFAVRLFLDNFATARSFSKSREHTCWWGQHTEPLPPIEGLGDVAVSGHATRGNFGHDRPDALEEETGLRL